MRDLPLGARPVEQYAAGLCVRQRASSDGVERVEAAKSSNCSSNGTCDGVRLKPPNEEPDVGNIVPPLGQRAHLRRVGAAIEWPVDALQLRSVAQVRRAHV